MKKITIILFVLFLAGCVGQSIKPQNVQLYRDPLPDLLTQAADSVYRVSTTTTFKFGEDGEEQQQTILGNAFAIDRHHILTVAHVVEINQYPIYSPYGAMMVYVSPEDKVKEDVCLLLDDGRHVLTKVFYKDNKLDFAILETEEALLFPTYFIGNSDDFKLLDKIFIISNFGTGENIRTGHIVQLNFSLRDAVDFGVYTRNFSQFGIQAPIEEGDSGAPVFLFRDGRLEIGGVISTVSGGSQGISYAVKINSIMDRFRSWQNEREW